MKLDLQNWKHWSTEKRSMSVFYPLVALAVVVFATFWFVGFDRPFDAYPNFNAPLFTDAILILSYLLMLLTLAVGLWSIVRGLKLRGKTDAKDNNIPVKAIGYIIFVGAIVLLVLTFLAGSAQPLTINGVKYNDWLWLKVSDMFINTSLVMLLLAVAAVVYGATKYNRRK